MQSRAQEFLMEGGGVKFFKYNIINIPFELKLKFDVSSRYLSLYIFVKYP